MATTGFWPIKGDLKGVVDYAKNPEKTTMPDELKTAIDYAGNPDKTERMMFVSALNCPKQRAYERMTDTKRRFGKLGGNVAYHGFQSFRPDEVTPEECHAIGVETARRMWGCDYEVLVATHLNTDALHNHFVVNSVSFRTGRKYENHQSDHIRLREISDEICREHGLSVLENAPFFTSDKSEYWLHRNGKLTHKDMLRRDVDIALSFVRDYGEMQRVLEIMGYEVMRDGERYEHLSVKLPDWKRSKRIDTLGPKYSTESLEKAFVENQQGIINIPVYLTRNRMTFEPQTIIHLQIELMQRKKYKESVVDIYYDLFIELLKVIKTAVNVLWQPLSPELRAEASNIEEYVAERRFIAEHNLLTESAIGDFVSATKAQISELKTQRTELDNRARRASPDEREQLHAERRAITERLKPLRQSLKTAESISRHIPMIEKLLETEFQMERDVLNGRTKTTNKSRNAR